MAKEIPENSSLIPPQPLPEGAKEQTFEEIATGLYSLASMLVGEGEDSIGLVENGSGHRRRFCVLHRRSKPAAALTLRSANAAVELIAQRDPEGLAAPVDLEHAVTCIEDDDLDAAAEAREAMERMIAGPDRDRVRTWLESLPTALRTIYVLRAVAGFSAPTPPPCWPPTVDRRAAGWTPEAVRELFRQGLCSLASQLIHATAGQ